MKIIINGAGGHMGREVCRLAESSSQMSIAARIDKMGGDGILTNIFDYSGEADVIIDFSHHSASPELVKYASEKNIPIVIATTGHDESELCAIEAASEKVAIFMSANMSLGVALLVELAKKTASVFPDADIEIIEKHHNRKLDAPSGTALMIAKAIEEVRRGIKFVYGRAGQQKREKDEIGIHAVRGGNIVGEHEVIVCTESQIITLKHEAQSRSLFAEGAISAASFLIGKGAGLYSMQDIAKSN
jgi:4-hydroxy-tetrahydrodipicolinate reductase